MRNEMRPAWMETPGPADSLRVRVARQLVYAAMTIVFMIVVSAVAGL